MSLDEFPDTLTAPSGLPSLSSSGPSAPQIEFSGNAQFQPIRYVGAGGMGVVYEALDKTRNTRVAVKALSIQNPSGLSRFKQEFRSLVDITHPNLATLYELYSEPGLDGAPDQWFFTMEFVDGVDFLSYVHGLSTPPATTTIIEAATLVAASEFEQTIVREDAGSQGSSHPGAAHPPVDFSLLRPALRQLVDAVAAIHAQGKLHRDLKPSNVLVTAEGRVVVLDFGLVEDLKKGPSASLAAFSKNRVIAGTCSYMSPEQARGDALNEASDWYAVGVMLYQALSGRMPYDGAVNEVLRAKQSNEPPRSLSGNLDAPPGLVRLCEQLLRPDASARPTLEEIRETLLEPTESAVAPAPKAAGEAPFVGRRVHLRKLEEVFETVKAGEPAIAMVHGVSGIGKSTLIARFIETKSRLPGVVVLTGRCYEQESVLYKTIDSLVDSLGRHLSTLGEAQVHGLLPKHAAELGQVFPVLRTIRAIAAAPRWSPDRTPAFEVRRLAFGALRELLRKLAQQAVVIAYIDDLQWGDLEGAELLADLLRPPAAPAVLLAVSFRDENAEASEPVRVLRGLCTRGAETRSMNVLDLAVEPLDAGEASELVRSVVGDSLEQRQSLIDEAGGNPFLLQEFAQYGTTYEEPHQSGRTALEISLNRRANQLAPEVRHLLAVVAVCGRPIRYSDACAAAGFAWQDQKALAYLRAGRFVRSASVSLGDDEIAAYHDRIREFVVASLDPPVFAAVNLQLAETLQRAPDVDPEVVGAHYEAAGRPNPAIHWFLEAANRSDAKLAFRYSVGLLRRAQALQKPDHPGRRSIELRLSDALAKAGFSSEAAIHYKRLAESEPGEESRFDLETKSAYLFAIGGHIDEGKAAFRGILSRAGLRLPESPAQALRAMLESRLRLWWRGLEVPTGSWTPNAAAERRVDVAWSAASALTMVDLVAAASFTTRHLLLAYQLGDPVRIVRGLVWEAVVRGTGTGDRATAKKMLDLAGSLISEKSPPYAQAIYRMGRALNQCATGFWRSAIPDFEKSLEMFALCPEAVWERSTARNFRLFARLAIGDMPAHEAEAHTVLEDAQERGDLYSYVLVGAAIQPLLEMYHDRPEQGLQAGAEALARWKAAGFHMAHIQYARSIARVKLYAGDVAEAWRGLVAVWPDLEQNFAFRSEWDRIGLHELRGRCAIEMLAGTDASAVHRKLLAESLRVLRKEKSWYAKATNSLLECGQSLLDDDAEAAMKWLDQSIHAFEKFDNPPTVITLRSWKEYLARPAAQRTLPQPDLTQWQISNPLRFARMILPVDKLLKSEQGSALRSTNGPETLDADPVVREFLKSLRRAGRPTNETETRHGRYVRLRCAGEFLRRKGGR